MALTYIKETHRTRGAQIEVALCPACLAESHWHGQSAHGYDREGYALELRPWRGEDRECSYCPTRHNAEQAAAL